MIALLIAALLQIGPRGDLGQLRTFLGADFTSAMRLVAAHNEALIANTARQAPAQSAQIRAETQTQLALPADSNIVALNTSNAGRGITTVLFEDDFITEQINLVFCPAVPAGPAPVPGAAPPPKRVIAVQVLLDDSRALGDTVTLLQNIYQLPAPADFKSHQPAFRYPLSGVTYDAQNVWTLAAGAPPVTVWNLGTTETIYQPMGRGGLVTGQLWLGDKNPSNPCISNVPLTR